MAKKKVNINKELKKSGREHKSQPSTPGTDYVDTEFYDRAKKSKARHEKLIRGKSKASWDEHAAKNRKSPHYRGKAKDTKPTKKDIESAKQDGIKHRKKYPKLYKKKK